MVHNRYMYGCSQNMREYDFWHIRIVYSFTAQAPPPANPTEGQQFWLDLGSNETNKLAFLHYLNQYVFTPNN